MRRYEETLNTLKYANRARQIQNKLLIAQDPVQARIADLLEQVATHISPYLPISPHISPYLAARAGSDPHRAAAALRVGRRPVASASNLLHLWAVCARAALRGDRGGQRYALRPRAPPLPRAAAKAQRDAGCHGE